MKVVVFSGTGDGRRLCRALAERGNDVTVCVATEYGASLMGDIKVHTGRMNVREMAEIMKDCGAVIDATHPYAAEATRNIRAACEASGKRCLRLLRQETEHDGCICVPDVGAAAEYLRDKSGGVFVSTGSKELHRFEGIGGRVRARVLDTPEVREKCGMLKIKTILYKMPPFSYQDNLEDFEGCGYLVTKDGGAAGGTREKLAAARALGMQVVMIRRPDAEEGGYSMEEIINDIDNRRSVSGQD